MRHLPFVVIASVLAVLTAACGASSEGPDPKEAVDGGDQNSGFGPSGTPSDANSACAASAKSAARAAVDVIFIIDTSASMGDETAQVRQNINVFARSIGNTGLDYNVIMLAEKGDPFGICVPEPLAGPDCADGPRFHHLATDINSWETLQLLLDQFPAYSAWLRPEAHKVFIVVTDDDAQLAYSKFDEQLLKLSPAQFGDAQKRRYIFNSICGYTRNTPVLSTATCPGAHNIGEQYQRLSQLTGGTIDSVCETSYAGVFDNITKGLLLKLGCEFDFPEANAGRQTDPTTVVVTYTPGSGSGPAPLTQVTDVSKCGAVANAWYYDNPTLPKKILFCPTTCSGPGADPGGKLDVAVGCKAPLPK